MRKKGNTYDNIWLWYELGVKARTVEDFEIALHHIGRIEKKRHKVYYIALLIFFVLAFVICLSFTTVNVNNNVNEVAEHVAYALATSFCVSTPILLILLPILLSSTFLPRRLSTCQETVRARANHPDVVYDLAQQQIGREWRREFLQIISESVAVCTMLFSVTGLDFLISRQSVLSGQFDMMVWCGWLPLMYFFLRTSGAGIWRRNPFAYKINFTPSTLSPEEEATTIQREISNLEERLAEIQDSQTAVTRPANRRV